MKIKQKSIEGYDYESNEESYYEDDYDRWEEK
jgi:hypothetical protein